MSTSRTLKNYGLVIAAAISVVLVLSIAVAAISNKPADATRYKGVNREFWIANMDNTKINETKVLLPADMFTTSTLVVKKGDNVTIHFFNVEDKPTDRHSFSIDGKPYAMNVVLNGGQNATINFIANQTGVWTYYCIYHEPMMKGQLVVEAPTLDELLALAHQR
ncbi:MAG: cupredoxin domain-containing protein [Nitrososphaera sp.]|jgi:plastocyanin